MCKSQRSSGYQPSWPHKAMRKSRMSAVAEIAPHEIFFHTSQFRPKLSFRYSHISLIAKSQSNLRSAFERFSRPTKYCQKWVVRHSGPNGHISPGTVARGVRYRREKLAHEYGVALLTTKPGYSTPKVLCCGSLHPQLSSQAYS